MAKLMKKHGDDTPIHFDEFLFNLDPSAYEIFEEAEVAVEPAPAPKPKKAKAASVEDDLNTAFDIDVI